MGRDARGGAAGRGAVHSPHDRGRGRAAPAGSGGGAGRHGDRDLARRAGLHPGAARANRRVRPGRNRRSRLAEVGLARLEELAEDGAASDDVIDQLRATLQARIGNARVRLDEGPGAAPGALTERQLRGDLIAAENAELTRLYEAGTISA